MKDNKFPLYEAPLARQRQPSKIILLLAPGYVLFHLLTRWSVGRYAGPGETVEMVMFFTCLGGFILLPLLAVWHLWRAIASRRLRETVVVHLVGLLLAVAGALIMFGGVSYQVYWRGVCAAAQAVDREALVAEARALLPGRGGFVPKKQWGSAIRSLHPRRVEGYETHVFIMRGGGGVFGRVGFTIYAKGVKPPPEAIELRPDLFYEALP
jgi:hypothetical protein